MPNKNQLLKASALSFLAALVCGLLFAACQYSPVQTPPPNNSQTVQIQIGVPTPTPTPPPTCWPTGAPCASNFSCCNGACVANLCL